LKARTAKSRFTRSAIALAVAAVLQSAPVIAQVVGGTITNPETGSPETITEVLQDPAYSVRTLEGNIIWVGPTTVGDTFTLTYRAAVPAQNGAPAIPERLAGTYRITARTLNAGNRVVGVSYRPDIASPPPAVTFDVVTYVGDAGQPGAQGDDEGAVDPPPVGNGSDEHQWLDRQHGRYGDNGSDGWGVEICIISCWTIGDDADSGGPGSQGPTLSYSINTAPISMESDNQHAVWVSSRGGDGGQGGDAYGIMSAARGGTAGRGGTVDITVNTDVTTTGHDSYGIFAQSRAGAAGDGGSGYFISSPGSGGAPAEGGLASRLVPAERRPKVASPPQLTTLTSKPGARDRSASMCRASVAAAATAATAMDSSACPAAAAKAAMAAPPRPTITAPSRRTAKMRTASSRRASVAAVAMPARRAALRDSRAMARAAAMAAAFR
jgi:hypothetical protein